MKIHTEEKKPVKKKRGHRASSTAPAPPLSQPLVCMLMFFMDRHTCGVIYAPANVMYLQVRQVPIKKEEEEYDVGAADDAAVGVAGQVPPPPTMKAIPLRCSRVG